MDLMKIATQLFISKLGGAGGGLDAGAVQSALGSLLGGGDGQLDLGDLLGKLQGGGLASMAQSWLGDGANEGISPQQVMSALGEGQIGNFASQLGLSGDQAAGGLAGMLPELIDQSSSGGNLLDAVGGASGLLGAASKLFK